MARRHEIDAFQKGDNSNTKIFKTMGNHVFPENKRNEECLKLKACISLKSLKTMGIHAFPVHETMHNPSQFLSIARKYLNLKGSHFRCLAL